MILLPSPLHVVTLVTPKTLPFCSKIFLTPTRRRIVYRCVPLDQRNHLNGRLVTNSRSSSSPPWCALHRTYPILYNQCHQRAAPSDARAVNSHNSGELALEPLLLALGFFC